MVNSIAIRCYSVIFCLFIFLSIHSQNVIRDKDVSGIYLSVDDFKLRRSYCMSCQQHVPAKIKLNQFFFSSAITIIGDNTKERIAKDSIFAIALRDGQCFRFINRQPCFIVDTSYLFIYKGTHKSIIYKQNGHSTKREELIIPDYYFSVGNHRVCHKLSLENLMHYTKLSSVEADSVFQRYKAN